MVPCSPRVGIMLACANQARLRRRNAPQPAQVMPASPITHVDGSGTVTGLARRKPVKSLSCDGGSFEPLLEDDKRDTLLLQPPPRSPRDKPAASVRSFHSTTFPL
jgi:hypothetical protein